MRNRSAALSFFDTDHGDGRPWAQGGALAWLDAFLRQQGIDDAAMNTTTLPTPAPTVPRNAPAAARSAMKLLERLRHGMLTVQLPDGSTRVFGEPAHHTNGQGGDDRRAQPGATMSACPSSIPASSRHR